MCNYRISIIFYNAVGGSKGRGRIISVSERRCGINFIDIAPYVWVKFSHKIYYSLAKLGFELPVFFSPVLHFGVEPLLIVSQRHRSKQGDHLGMFAQVVWLHAHQYRRDIKAFVMSLGSPNVLSIEHIIVAIDVFQCPNSEVLKIRLEANTVEYVETRDGERLQGKYIISSLHPVVTFSLLENNTVYKKAFFTRINSLKNTHGIFSTYLLTKRGTLKYVNRNNYMFNTQDVWATEGHYKGFNIPSVLMCMQPNHLSEHTEVVTLLAPMPLTYYQKWLHTKVENRGEEYREFKAEFSEAVIDFVAEFYPNIRSYIDKVYTASPLTYRDYTATPLGTAYGIVKDYRNPIVTHIPAKTRISNLLLTGQNLNIHGCIGTTVSSAVTSSEILGVEYLSKKIGNA
jgi:hypothetical protein